MNHLLREQNLEAQIQCDSAGTSGYHVGSAPDRRMTVAAKRQGITLAGQSRQFEPEDFEKFDLILAMDKDNYRDILRLDRNGEYGDRVQLMCSFCQHHNDDEVPDPYYGGEAGFNYVIDLLKDACQGLLDHVQALK